MMVFNLLSLGELGEWFLLLAFVTGLCQFLLALSPSVRWEASKIAGTISFITTILSFCVLLYAFGIQDYTIKSVYLHSHSSTPFLFRIAASWGHHEGSLMLWVVFSAWYGVLGIRFLEGFTESFKKSFLGVLGFNEVVFIGFILFASNPFEDVSFLSSGEGKDLNPLLQDISLLIHPPFLYMGFVGFLLPYALSLAYLLFPQNKDVFLENLKKSTAVAWAFLTLGIGLGSFWAYYELGWGGYWFWDPVENASLIPWLGGCILLHALGLWKQHHNFARWSLGWSLLLYPLSILGTFMVRSGLLTSVHAFAFDPKRGLFIFCILLVFLGVAVCAFLKGKVIETRPLLEKTKLYPSLFLLLQNGIFLFFLSIVLVGTFYPLFSQVFFKVPLYVGPTYYTTLMAPCAICALVLLVFLPTSDSQKVLRFYEREDILSLLGGLVLALLFYKYKGEISFLGALFFWASLSVCLRLFLYAIYVRKKPSFFFAHFGIGVFMVGVLISAFYMEETQILMKKGEKITFSGITLEMRDLQLEDNPSHITAKAILEEKKGDFTLVPERRFYKVRGQETSEVALSFLQKAGFLSHFYVRLGEEITPQVFEMHFKYYPFISLIWIGWGFVAIGGFFVLFSNRKRRPTVRSKKGTYS